MTTDAELDRMYEAAIADDWEDRNREDTAYETLSIAVEKALKLLSEAYNTICGAVDEHSRYFDIVMSYCNDIEDLSCDLKGVLK